MIKLVKSSLKEPVCANFSVMIPQLVYKEIIEDGKEHPDAVVVRNNLERKLLTRSKQEVQVGKGEEAVYAVFQKGNYDAICSDDKRFTKRLRLFDIPYLTPAVLIALLLKKQKITVEEALNKLESLSPMISDEEYSTVKVVLETWRIE